MVVRIARLILSSAGFVLLALSHSGPIQAQDTATSATVDARLEELDHYIEHAREAWKVPGLAVAVVKDDHVLLAKGYGVCKVGEDDRVDQHTLFAIASNSKAFTAAALAMLVEEGKLNWDDRVRKFLPWFELYDPYVSADIRVRDLLCHRSGLGTFSGDLLWYGTDYSPRQVLRRARHLKPKAPFRAGYGYSNLMFLAAGEVIESAGGMSWHRLVKERIFVPLQMDRTVTSIDDLPGLKNVATPHKTLPNESRPIGWVDWDNIAAAGGIISSVDDMAKWMRLQLNRGELASGQRLFSDNASREMWSPHAWRGVSKESQDRFPTTHFRAYGLGWGLSDYHGRLIVAHGGGYDGMYSQLMLVPEEELGIVVLTNSMTSISEGIAYRVIDQFLGREPRDWSEENRTRFEDSRHKFYRRIAKATTPVKSGTSPSLALEAYAGRYGGQMYGDAIVERADDKLVLRLLPNSKLVADLRHLHYDTFVIDWRHEFAWFEEGTAQFLLDARGQVSEMKLDVPNDDLWFDELEFKRRNGD